MTRLAVDGGVPVRLDPFPAWPQNGELEEELLVQVIRSGKWGGSGRVRSPEFRAKIPQLEETFARLQDAGHGVACVNGTMAITVALLAAGVEAGDEVIMPPYTFIATASAALLFGAIPVFVDVEPDTFLIDPEKIEAAITPRTKAIVAVHLGGLVADLTRLKAICATHDLKLIEDAAQAIGAQWDGTGVGAIGDLGTFSFQSTKNLTAGEGGMVLSNDRALAERVWSICNVGRIPEGAWYQHVRLGWNLRMTELQAAVLLAQMSRLADQLERRERNGRLLTELLADVEGIAVLRHDPRVTRHGYHLYSLRLRPDWAAHVPRADLIRKVRAEGIPVEAGYGESLHKNRALLAAIERQTGERPVFDCPVSERLAEQEALRFPQNVLLADEKAMYDIAEGFRKVLGSY